MRRFTVPTVQAGRRSKSASPCTQRGKLKRLFPAAKVVGFTGRSRITIKSFRQFIGDNRDEIAALQILYSRPQSQRLTYRCGGHGC